jgi:hypothetical protein
MVADERLNADLRTGNGNKGENKEQGRTASATAKTKYRDSELRSE